VKDAVFRVTLPPREKGSNATCRHCGDVGPAGEDHTCSCPNSDLDCRDHPLDREQAAAATTRELGS